MSAKLYAVSRYVDQIKVKQAKEYFNQEPRYHYFDDEESARKFIIARADSLADQAKIAMKKAEARWTRCVRKFGRVKP